MTMEEDNKRKKCPVCGRFCKAEAVDRYNGLIEEKEKLAKELDSVCEELGSVRKALVEAQEQMGEAVRQARDYEDLYINARGKTDEAAADVKSFQDKLVAAGVKMTAMQSDMRDLIAENERLRNRGFFARLFNKA